MAQWDFQNKGTRTSPARLSFVLKVPLRNLRPSVIYSVPCERIVQRAYSHGINLTHHCHYTMASADPNIVVSMQRFFVRRIQFK